MSGKPGQDLLGERFTMELWEQVHPNVKASVHEELRAALRAALDAWGAAVQQDRRSVPSVSHDGRGISYRVQRRERVVTRWADVKAFSRTRDQS